MEFAGTIAVGLLVVVAVFQIVLALGAPYGKAAWGGAHDGVLPTPLRGASALVGLVIYPAIIAVVLSASGLIDADLVPGDGAVTMWVLAVLFLLGAIANAVSRSRVERWWAPVSLALALCCAAMALGL
jgi:hypothetical protein